MNALQFETIYDHQLVSMIHELSAEATGVKAMIFKANISNSAIDKYKIQHYLSFVNDFIAAWDNLSKELAERMRSIKGAKGIRAIDYEDIKDYVYANYDYASVLWFASRVITGIKEGKFKTPRDIEEFFDNTLTKAFDDQPATVAGLVDSVTSANLNTLSETTAVEAKMFDSIAKNKKLFPSTCRSELYKSIKETIEFLSSELSVQDKLSISSAGLFASMINNIIEYITYSVTAFATRIYAIAVYAKPFINQPPAFRAVNESVDPEELSHMDSIEITIMRDADEVEFKNFEKYKESMAKLKEFLRLIGGWSPMGDEDSRPHIDELSNDNMFRSKLLDNPLHEFFLNKRYLDYESKNRFTEMSNLLKEFIYNGSQAVETSSSSKQAILHVIRAADSKTSKGYQDMAKDLYMYSKNILGSISNLKRSVDDDLRYRVEDRCPLSISEMNAGRECDRMLDELYRDIAFAILQKARDIESNINALNGAHLKDVLGNISVKVPGGNKELNLTTNNSSLSAPDSMRIPVELADMYAMPAFESMQMFDEYLRTTTEFSDDMYLSEAFNISQAINKLVALVKGFWNKVKSFYENKKLDLAIKWVAKYKSELSSMDFSNVKMEILPYKKKGIGLPDGFDNFEKGLDAFDPSKFTNEDSINKYIRTLYPNPVMYDWFSKGEAVGTRMYKNSILYQEINAVTAESPKLTPINGNAIKPYLDDWISTIEGAPNTYKYIKEMSEKFISKMEEIKNKTLSSTSSSSSTENSSDNKSDQDKSQQQSSGGSQTSQSANDSQPKTGNDQQQAEEKKNPSGNIQGGDMINKAVNGLEIATNRIWGNLLSIFIEYTTTQYGYIKEVYRLGTKKQ